MLSLYRISDGRIIDWDDVRAVPLPMSAITPKDSFFSSATGKELHLIEGNRTFQRLLADLESSHPPILNTSQLYVNSSQHYFLTALLQRAHKEKFTQFYPELVAAALNETTNSQVGQEWDYFCFRYFLNRGLRVPDWPQYIDVQEQLGRHRRKTLHKVVNKLRWKELPTHWTGIPPRNGP